MSRSRYSYLALGAVVLLLLPGCALFNKAKSAAAKGMGVKTTTRSVKIADLGPEYQSIADTEYDAFSAKSGTAKKVTYKHFGVKSLDAYLEEANALYASYVIAGTLIDKTSADLAQFVGKDVYAIEEKELVSALKSKSVDDVNVVERLKVQRDNVQLFTTNLGTIVEKASGVKEKGQGMVSSIPGEFQKDPARALVLDEAISELKTSVERLSEVVTGAPDLVTRAGKLGTSLTIVASAIGVGGTGAPADAGKPGTKPAGKQPAGKQPAGKQPAGGTASGVQPGEGTAAETQPADGTPTKKRPPPPPPKTKKAPR